MDMSMSQKYHTRDLLEAVKECYPSQYNTNNLRKAVHLGSGIDAHAYAVGSRVFKFTQNKQHAKVSAKLINKNFKHLVKTYSVDYLPKLKLWCIQEERLGELPKTVYDRIKQRGFCPLPPTLQEQLDSVEIELAALGVRDYWADCLSAHNLLRDTKTKLIKANDFGYTKIKYYAKLPTWT